VSLAEFVFLAAFTLGQSAMRMQTAEPEHVAASQTAAFVRTSVVIGVAFALVTSALAYPFVRVVYGVEWAGSVAPLVVLTFAAVGLTVEAPLRTFLVRVLRPVVVSVPAAAALAVNVAANLALIPVLGITGAALSSLLSYACYGAVALRFFSSATGLPLLGAGRHPGPGRSSKPDAPPPA
jgi:stage V sporulation protein B